MSSNEVKVGALTLGGIGLLAGIITFLGAFSSLAAVINCRFLIRRLGG